MTRKFCLFQSWSFSRNKAVPRLYDNLQTNTAQSAIRNLDIQGHFLISATLPRFYFSKLLIDIPFVSINFLLRPSTVYFTMRSRALFADKVNYCFICSFRRIKSFRDLVWGTIFQTYISVQVVLIWSTVGYSSNCGSFGCRHGLGYFE